MTYQLSQLQHVSLRHAHAQTDPPFGMALFTTNSRLPESTRSVNPHKRKVRGRKVVLGKVSSLFKHKEKSNMRDIGFGTVVIA
jgi:hypothetical protein